MNKLKAIGKTVAEIILVVLLGIAIVSYLSGSIYCFVMHFVSNTIALGLFACSIPGVIIITALTMWSIYLVIYKFVHMLYELYQDNLEE